MQANFAPAKLRSRSDRPESQTGVMLTLVQTGKIEKMPILLFGKDFWTRVIDFEELMLEGVISPPDLDLFRFVDTAAEAWGHICDFYEVAAKN